MSDYKTGFGEVVFNSWIGLENIVRIQAAHSAEAVMEIYLLVDNFECKIEYRDVTIKDEMSGYAFTSTGAVAVSSFTFCGDALLSSISLLNQSFSTADIDSTGDYECAIKYGGGWWYKDHVDCTRGFLTGTMDGSGKDNFWFNANGINEVAVQLRFI
ncbi:hypothetical protein SNE40_019281 [Patella caerulea]|uniref:Fibrinogen C-terminal domain-containing protein n=1 Tax=Patella caerulea TaxID=87958 RepID=A0AAN8J6A8_PATCE